MCVDLVDIDAEECGTSPGGVVKLELGYAKDIDAFPAPQAAPNDNVVSANITMKAGKYFRRWTFDEDTCKIDYNIVGSTGSLSVEAILEMDLSKMTPSKSRQLDQSLNGRFILIATDANGIKHLIGDPNGRTARRQPATSTTGLVNTDKNLDKLIFRCAVGTRKFYTGVVPLEPAV